MADRRAIRDPARVVPGRPLDYQLGGESATTKHIYKVLQSLQSQLTQVIEDAALAASTAVATKTADYTLTASDGTIYGDTSLGAFTLTLPTAVGNAGKNFTIKNIGDPVHDLTVAARVGQEVERDVELVISVQDTSLEIRSNGSTWRIH